MADVTFLHGLNRSDGINQLIAGYENDIHRFEEFNNTWNGMLQPIDSSARGRTTTFLDSVFWVNGIQNNKRYNGLVWTDEITTKKAPLAKLVYAHPTQTRVFLGDVTWLGKRYASRVWYSDLPKNNDITYGLEYGTDLIQTAGGRVVRSSSSYFITRNLKVGNPFLIVDGPNAGEYRIESIDTENQITLTTSLDANATGSSFWCGGNFFDVVTNNNDVVKGFTDNSDQLLVFKINSLYRYNHSQLKKIKGVPGTWSQESIVNIGEFSYYFHNTGIWRTDASTSVLISRPVQNYIEGIDSEFYPNVVAWPINENVYRIFIGNVVNVPKGINVENCILDFDTITNTWTPGKLNIKVTAATSFIENNITNIYLGNDEGKVYLENTGTSDDGIAIPWFIRTGFIFPSGGPQIQIELTRMEIHNQAGRGISVKYKLYGTPNKTEKEFKTLGDLTDEVTVLKFALKIDEDVIARGLDILLAENSTIRAPIIERIDIFYKLRHIRDI